MFFSILYELLANCVCMIVSLKSKNFVKTTRHAISKLDANLTIILSNARHRAEKIFKCT